MSLGCPSDTKSTDLEHLLGEGALKSSTMLKKINAARHDEVPGQMKRWKGPGQDAEGTGASVGSGGGALRDALVLVDAERTLL
jgi:hypothetical protein